MRTCPNAKLLLQLGLHFSASGRDNLALESFQKALVIEIDYTPAMVHLAQHYLKPVPPASAPTRGHVDLAYGLLMAVTQSQGWDVPEAWYFLAKACALQGRHDREREYLVYALQLQESRCLRPIGTAVPRCL